MTISLIEEGLHVTLKQQKGNSALKCTVMLRAELCAVPGTTTELPLQTPSLLEIHTNISPIVAQMCGFVYRPSKGIRSQ